MSTLIKKPESGSHWYFPDGTACHEQPYADPSKGMRKTNLTDARKLGLFPSVTNYLAMKAKPRLTDWLIEQGILSSLTLPQNEGETDDAFAARVLEDSKKEGRQAADRGTLIHDITEGYCLNGYFDCNEDMLPFVEPVEKWYDENVESVISTEESLISLLFGYAGRTDLIYVSKKTGRKTVADWKTKKVAKARRVKSGELRPEFFIEWSMQLAAYRSAFIEMHQGTDAIYEGEIIDIESIIIPSDEATGEVYSKVWDNGDAALKAFHGCRDIWCFEKNYYPGGIQ